jgi:DNA-binding HxlR family transcriptional regulator
VLVSLLAVLRYLHRLGRARPARAQIASSMPQLVAGLALLVGCRTLNEIADGAPGLSRGLLSKRLRELEHAGIIEIRAKPNGTGSTYEPTQAGSELSEVMLALHDWGSKWAELKPEHAHPGVVLWAWVTFWLDHDRLPRRRVVVRFDYPTVPGPAPPLLGTDRAR